MSTGSMPMNERPGLALGTAAFDVSGSLILPWLGIRTVRQFSG